MAKRPKSLIHILQGVNLMVAEHNKSALHIERIRLKFGFKRTSPEQKEIAYVARLSRLEVAANNAKRVIVSREKVGA